MNRPVVPLAAELSVQDLNRMIAKHEGRDADFSPATSLRDAGPLIDREAVVFGTEDGAPTAYIVRRGHTIHRQTGETRLIAACRAMVVHWRLAV